MLMARYVVWGELMHFQIHLHTSADINEWVRGFIQAQRKVWCQMIHKMRLSKPHLLQVSTVSTNTNKTQMTVTIDSVRLCRRLSLRKFHHPQGLTGLLYSYHISSISTVL